VLTTTIRTIPLIVDEAALAGGLLMAAGITLAFIAITSGYPWSKK
jgi:hypothetical protein